MACQAGNTVSQLHNFQDLAGGMASDVAAYLVLQREGQRFPRFLVQNANWSLFMRRGISATALDVRAASLLERMGQLEDARFAEWRPKDLQPDGQLATGFATRNGNAWNARERPRNRINISKIHLERVVHSLAETESGYGRSRGEKRINLLKGVPEILGDERANLLPLEVVRVVIARGKNVGSQHDAAFDLGAEARAPRFAVHGEE